MKKPKLLLQTCCGVCSAFIPKLLSIQYKVVIYYYNPNIHPRKEYEKRLNESKKIARILNLNFIEEKYKPEQWHNIIKGFEKEPEGGKRCYLCFKLRLEQTAQYAKKNNFKYFATTLTVGRNKKAEIINKIGLEIAKKYNLVFIDEDFKKFDNITKSQQTANKFKIYKQNYCGCIYSYKKIPFNK